MSLRFLCVGAVLPLGLFLLLAGCPASSPGCTYDNCHAAIFSCRVEPIGGPNPLCINVQMPAMPADFAKYCVDDCNAAGLGPLMQCVADHAGQCEDAGIGPFDVSTACAQDNGPSAEQSCSDQCNATHQTCDDMCTGGHACQTCRLSGMSSCPDCPSTTYQQCIDCSAQCGLNLIGCLNHCPRQ